MTKSTSIGPLNHDHETRLNRLFQIELDVPVEKDIHQNSKNKGLVDIVVLFTDDVVEIDRSMVFHDFLLEDKSTFGVAISNYVL
jgi:hypothetical protein